MKKILLLTIIFSITTCMAVVLYFHGFWQFNYPGKGQYPIRGIDISHHQGKIDWNKVKGEGFNFVFIKATEGGNFKDPEFDRNWKESSRIGLLR